MRFSSRISMVVAALALLTGGCGSGNSSDQGTPAASNGPSANARYGAVTDLRDAAVQAGHPCKHWKQSNVVTLAAESGSCSGGDVFSTFASAAELQRQVRLSKALDQQLVDSHLTPTPHLVGPNWMITAHDVPKLRASLGGTIVQVGSQ